MVHGKGDPAERLGIYILMLSQAACTGKDLQRIPSFLCALSFLLCGYQNACYIDSGELDKDLIFFQAPTLPKTLRGFKDDEV